MGGSGYNNYNMGMGGSNMSNQQRGIKRQITAVDSEAEIMRKLFVGNLDFNTTEEQLKAHFEQYGEVEKVNMHKNHETGKSKGSGFVTFQNSSGVDNVQMCRPHKLEGKILDTKRAIPKGENIGQQEDIRAKKIFIGAPEDEKQSGGRGHFGLTEEIEDDDLSNYLASMEWFQRLVSLLGKPP